MSDHQRGRQSAPVPRDHDDASLSELMPFRSTKIKLVKSPLFIFMVVSALISTFMFGMMGPVLANPGPQAFAAFQLFVSLTIFVILMMFVVGIYAYSRSDRPIWTLAVAWVLCAVQVATPLFILYEIPFRRILPGNIDVNEKTPFITAFISMFFGAGLLEELLKASPILLGAWLTVAAAKNAGLKNNIAYKALNIRGPLDGVIMGVFTGAAFIFIETAFEYVPRVASEITKGGDYRAGVAAGMLLLIPRVMGGAVGHMAYSAIFGYFIGLSVLRGKKRWQLLGIGWLAAATIHGLWNSVSAINYILNYVVAVIAAVGAGAALLKARQIDAAELGRENFTSGSILVERPPAAQPAARPPMPEPTVQPVAQPASQKTEKPLALDIEGLILPLRSGAALDLAAEPALGGRGAGVRGQIVPHPTRANVIGLQNAGDTAWTARLRDGSQQVIERNQNIRLAAGVQIEFGAGLSGRVVALG